MIHFINQDRQICGGRGATLGRRGQGREGLEMQMKKNVVFYWFLKKKHDIKN